MSTNIETSNQTAKRYVVNISFYLSAEDDAIVKKESIEIAAALNKQHDCKASVDGIVEQPFGTIVNRTVPI